MDIMTLNVARYGPDGGPVLVLLHGATADHRMWGPQIGPLAERCQVLAPDLPGYGGSPGPFSLEAAVEQVAELIGEHGRAHVCGLSLGAMAALRLASTRPEQVESLILSGVQVKPPRALVTLQGLVMRLIPAKKFSSGDSGVTKATVLGAMSDLAGCDLRPDLSKVSARTLVLCGADDRVNLGAARRAAEGIAGAELRIVPGAGHVLNQDKPELFTGTIIEWTASADG